MTPTTLTHPVWCGLVDAGCTVILPMVAVYAAHRSRPVLLDLSESIGLPSSFRVATVHLEQVQTSWDTDVYVMVRLGPVEFSLPVDATRSLLADLGKLIDRAYPPLHVPEDIYPAELATRNGFPAAAGDDECPRCHVAWGTEWQGPDDFGANHWSHTFIHPDAVAEDDPEPCGLRWTTPVRAAETTEESK